MFNPSTRPLNSQGYSTFQLHDTFPWELLEFKAAEDVVNRAPLAIKSLLGLGFFFH